MPAASGRPFENRWFHAWPGFALPALLYYTIATYFAMPMHYKLTRLLLLPTANKPNTTAEAFIANPPIDQESLLGKLFFVAEIESNRAGARKALDFLAESLSRHYYQAEKISMREKMGTLRVADIFEAALARVNADFELFTKRERVKISPNSYAITAGVVHGSTLVFSTAGSIQAMVLYPERDQSEEGKKRYKITAVTDADASERKVRLEKLFSNLTEGKLPAEGYAVFSNEILPEYITNRHLSKIITTLPPQSAVEQMKNQLHKINNHVTFVALIIKNSKAPQVQRSIPNLNVNVTAHNSLERMQETEHATERYLSPAGAGFGSGWGRVRERIGALFTARSPKVNAVIRDKLFFAKKSRLKAFGKLRQAAAFASAAVASAAARLWQVITNPRQSLQRLRSFGRVTLQTIMHIAQWFIRLPRLHKGLIAVFLIAIALFFGNIYRQSRSEQTIANQAEYQSTLHDLQQQHNQIRASLLYRNKEGARKLLAEAQEKLQQLTAIAGKNAPVVATLRQEQQEYLDTLSNVTVIENPHAVATVANNAAHLAMANGVLAAFAPNDTAVDGVHTQTGETFAAAMPTPAVHGTRLNDESVLVFGKEAGVEITADETTETITGVFERADERIIATGSYNGRLYAIDADQDELWRYAVNFNSKQAWLKEDMELDTVSGMAIDGYIYLAFTDGSIRRYLSGYQNEFEPAQVTPALTSANGISLTGTSDQGQVYVLDRANNRIVVFDKTGAFIAQYRFDTLAPIADFTVTDDNTRGYVLSEGTVYEFAMNHKE